MGLRGSPSAREYKEKVRAKRSGLKPGITIEHTQ
jgi:hypothetical protein